MELLILSKAEAEANRGEYMPHHFIEPVKIEDYFYILNRDLSEVKELESYREAILSQPFFTRGDDSKYDLKYIKYLEAQNEII